MPANQAKRTRVESVVLRLGATRSITISVGTLVLVRDGANDSYGAVVSSLDGACARLTFTPEGKPRRVPMGKILGTASARKGATIDPSSVPRYQPEPTVIPRHRKAKESTNV